MKRKISILSIFLIIAVAFSGCSGEAKNSRMLSNFEDIKPWDISPETGFTLSLSKEYVTEGANSLKVVYPIDTWPSINTKKLLHNWGDYEYFCFDVYNPQNENISFTTRLDDNKRKRANIEFSLKNGWNYVKIPKRQIASRINADEISFVVLFLNRPSKRIILYFDNMRLVKAELAKKQQSKNRQEAIIKEVFEQFSVESALPKEGVLEVAVVNLSSPKKVEVFVSNGIPFAPGQLFSEKNFAVFNRAGEEIPIAVRVLARWGYDNSIRSLLVQFPLEIEHKYMPVYIQWGKPRATQDVEVTEVNWIMPEGFLLLPAEWLCYSQVVGEQVPVGKHPFPKYDQNIEKYYPKMRDFSWTGDIRKDGYYNTPHVFYQLYARSGDDEYFKSARRELVHYRDDLIIQQGPERGRNINYKDHRYIFVQAMLDDYLLTGDSKSLVVAGYMAEYLRNNFNPEKAFYRRNASHFWTERNVAFPFLGIISYYELTGDKKYLETAQDIMQNIYRTQNQWPDRGGFIHNLYAHDPEEGARRDEYGGSPFMTGLLLEAVVKYHQVTHSNIAKDSLFRALDWLIKEGLSADGNSVAYLTCDKHRYSAHPDLNLLIAHAFGYGYKISGYEREDYLEVGQNLFEEGINKAYLKDRKHFNQNYRSSGHFLAYIKKDMLWTKK